MHSKTEDELATAHAELQLARSNYEKGMIRERIRQIERSMQHNPIQPIANTAIQHRVLAIHDTQSSSKSVWHVHNEKDTQIDSKETVYETVRVTGCSGVRIDKAHAKTSCYIEDTHKSEIYIVAQQIRIKACTKLTLHAHTKTGVYIEDTEDIVIHAYTPEYEVEWKNNTTVHDFSCTSVV